MNALKTGLCATVTLLMAGNAAAWDCDYSKEISKTLNLSGTQIIEISARAGELEIEGNAAATEATITATACVSKEEWLAGTDVIVESGETAQIIVQVPDYDSGVSWGGNKYVYVDLAIEVPADMALDVKDSSGDIDIRSTGSLSVKDSSGDIDITDVNGDVILADSSGDIELRDISGQVTVENDSSGDIRGTDINGGVLVMKDSSGDINFRDVSQDFVVERDSSGDIVANGVGGDFAVLRDGSGSIRHSDVNGAVSIPEDD